MNLSRLISKTNWKIYSTVGRVLDDIFAFCKRSPGAAKGLVMDLLVWRRSINKMHRDSSPDRPILEKINLSRALKDIDSLIWRLGKIAPIGQVKVDDDPESENQSGTGEA